MCGILGVFGFAEPVDVIRPRVLRYSKMLRHRGPDWNGIHCSHSAILAHERLAIVGLNSGAQPITDKEQRIFLSVNGEIYNHLAIRAQLEKDFPGIEEDYMTDSDCEVLIHLYRKKGPDFLRETRINGMFAFVLYDERADRIVAGRDHAGMIPLYQGNGRDGSLWFASEMKAIQEECEPFEVFPPGHYFVGSKGPAGYSGLRIPFMSEAWFSGSDPIPGTKWDAATFRDQLTAAVERHLMTEVPFGVLLSGGLDSSLVAAITNRLIRASGNRDLLRSFCIGLAGSPDLAAAQKVADFLGTRHYSFEYTIQEGLDALSDVIYHLETYDVTTIRASTPMFLMARKIKATGVKMVLSGEGSDEVFAGYLYFHKAPNREELHRESVRKLRELHQYDCLRANKAMMAWGVEARVPFLDRDFLEYAMSLDPAEKLSGNRIEKHLVRQSFDVQGDPYLPTEVLWRQKEQFSDGVGYGWIDSLKAQADRQITDLQMQFAASRFPIHPPTSKEAYLYREIFEHHFPSPFAAKTVPYGPSIACSSPAAIAWDASFQNNADPSGRAIHGVHQQAYRHQEFGKESI